MKIKELIATFFYIGKLPFAPGSWGSAITLLLWYFLPINLLLHCLMLIIIFIVGMKTASPVAKKLNSNDPSEIVIDEVLGMCIALFMLPHNFMLYFFAFILFRIFDIFKPSIIYHTQKLPGSWGIMMDDVVAGLLTRLLLIGITANL